VKLEQHRIDAFLHDPGAATVVLLYGDDIGLIRDRAAQLVRAVAGSLKDPFRVVTIDGGESGRISEEMASLSLGGGRRVVRFRDASDADVHCVQPVLDSATEGGSNLLVLEAAGLGARSRLRAAVEKAPRGVGVACYQEQGRTLEHVVQTILANSGVRVDADALAWLVGRLGADRGVTQSEISKLTLFAGENGTVDLDAARACVGDLAGLSLEDALSAATSGDVAGADRALGLAMDAGGSAVGVLRACLMHLHRMQRAGLAMQGGVSALDAAKAARPPVFFRRQPAFAQSLKVWPQQWLAAAMVQVWEAELACKRTGAPADVICRSTIISLAQRGAAARRR
jgi:DNA polymerase III subunit delta